MKTFYISLLTILLLWSCSSMQNMNASIEDDIYYVPNEKPLMVKEVETITGQRIDMSAPATRNAYSNDYPEDGSAVVINRRKGTTEKVSTSELAAYAENILHDPYAPEATTLYTNTGYWIGGFKGNDSDLQEAARIINRYPEGFGFISNGQDIALNLSISPDWNVYTDNGRYWWFPSSSNIRLYNTFLFGTYPKYIWTVVWNEPFYDSWAFDATFNRGFSLGLNIGWGNPGWSFGFGWNSGWYRPWYNPYYGFYDPWYDPWWGGYYPGWGYPHWHHPYWNHPHWHHPNWGGHYPGWAPPSSNRPNRPGNPRPNIGSGSIGLRPGINRPGSTTRPNYNNQRPGSSVRPGSESSRPGNNAGTRPGMTRPNYNNGRPGTVNPRPNYNTTRPTTTRPTNSNSRPTTVRPGNNGNTNRYTRPATRPNTSTNTSTNRSNNVKNYNRQPNNYRPTYNNNRTYNRSNTSNRSSYTAPRISSPSRSGGTHVTPSRSTNRSGGRR